MMQAFQKLMLLSLFLKMCSLSRDRPLVDAPAGRIRGLVATKGNYTMFLGIPFAQVDAYNPFGPSKPQPIFEDVFQADDDSVMCPQLNLYNNKVEGSVNCLHLHVYVPNTANSHNKLPVMVHIPGGAFIRGVSGRYQYGPKYLVRYDVILVSFNHRLGPYGFMCLHTPEIPGNQGLKDQVTALNWIKSNIDSFGGDPNRITIFGFSSGGRSVDFHLTYLNPKLFSQAIIQSGSRFQFISVKTPDLLAPLKMAQHLGMETNSTSKALSFLATVNPKIMIETVMGLKIDFSPCFEREFHGDPYLTESWSNLNPKSRGKNIMLGIDEYDNAGSVSNDMILSKKDIFYKFLSDAFDFSNDTLKEISEVVKHFYLGSNEISFDVRTALEKFCTDFFTVHPMERSLRKIMDDGPKKVYYYMFAHFGKRNNGQIKFHFPYPGAIHGDEIGYLFDPVFLNVTPTPEDQLIIDRMTTLWTNFAKYGNPTPHYTNLLPVKWTPVSKDQHNYLRISTNMTMENSLYQKRMAFWDCFYKIIEKDQKT